MPANDFVLMQYNALRHHIKPKQLRIYFKKLFLISLVHNQAQEWTAQSPELDTLNSV